MGKGIASVTMIMWLHQSNHLPGEKWVYWVLLNRVRKLPSLTPMDIYMNKVCLFKACAKVQNLDLYESQKQTGTVYWKCNKPGTSLNYISRRTDNNRKLKYFKRSRVFRSIFNLRSQILATLMVSL